MYLVPYLLAGKEERRSFFDSYFNILVMSNKGIINVLDSDDEALPEPSGLSFSISSDASHRATPITSQSVNKRAATTAIIKSVPKKVKPSKAFCLIWVCTHGKGRRSSWRKKDLQIVGVYASKDAAQKAKEEVMSRYDCCGHGDILVGGCWDDEIDLVIREAPMSL